MERSFFSRPMLLLLLGSMTLGVSAQDYDDDYGDDDIVGFDDDDDDDSNATAFVARLRGLHEVPSISTAAQGSFRADVDEASSMITYTLTYENLGAPVEQAHIHVGQVHTNGGVSAFLCTNLENGPPDTQPCPEGTAEISGAIMAPHVVGPSDQGISEGEFEELLAAIRAKAAYANVHTTMFPAGEIRGQIVPADR